MQCPKCQFENREGVRFCEECGANFDLTCPNCSAKIPRGRKFCGECGFKLTEPSQSPAINYSKPQSYTPKFLVDKILTTRSSIEGERKLVTVLFADVANYTSISEKLDPEEVHQIMDGCFRILIDEVHRHEGTINQFTGDGVMAIFGAPVAQEDHAGQACHAALSMQKELVRYEQKVAQDYGVEFKMRMGLNSGMVVVGAIGDDLRMDYTADGDTTNLAARLESLAQPGVVFVSGNTHRLVKDYFELKPLGKFDLKGKAEIQEVFELIKTGGAATRIEAASARGLTKFVGREDSLATLMNAYEKVGKGVGQVLGIVGEPGVGKSRLLLEFRNRLSQEQSTYLGGRCIHFGSSVSYLPILDILRRYFGVQDGESEIAIRTRVTEKIVRLDENLSVSVAPLLDLMSLNIEDNGYIGLEPKQRKERIFEGLRNLLIRMSQERRLVLAIDDIHWVDKTTEEFLDYFIGWIAKARIMLILLYRPEYTHRWGSKSYFTRIGLDQLSLGSSAELVKAILEREYITQELSDLILHRAAGNPFFMEELTRELLENGSIRKEADQYVLACKPSELKIPDTVQGIIASRIDRLKDSSKRVMQGAAVIGREFAFRVLQTVVNGREELKAHLLNLQGLEFIYEKTLFPELEYIFKHALTQKVVYNSLLISRRKDIHKRIGKVIEELYSERIEEFYEILAFHYTRSEEQEKAYQYLKLSGDKAYSRYANWEAFRFYREAIRVCNRLPQTESVRRKGVEARLCLYPPAVYLGFPEDTLELFEEGVEESQKLGELRKAAEFEARLASAYAFKGKPVLAAQHGERCFKGAERNADLDLMTEAARDLCAAYTFRGDYKKILSITFKVIPLLEAENIHQVYGRGGSSYGRLCSWSGMALGYLGQFEEGIALCEKAYRASFTYSHAAGMGLSEMMMGIIFNVRGDGSAAVEHLQRAREFFESINAMLLLGPTLANMGYGHMLSGDPETGRVLAEQGMGMHVKAGIPYYLPMVHFILGECNIRLDNINIALFHGEESLRLARIHEERHMEGQALKLLGRVHAFLNNTNFEQMEDLLQQSIEIFRELDTKPDCALAHLYLCLSNKEHGQTEKAMGHLKIATDMFRAMGMDYWLEQVQELKEGF